MTRPGDIRRLPRSGLILLLAALAAAAPAHDPAEGPDLVVTTDSRAYCDTLAQAIKAHRQLPDEVRALEAQGISLCDEGQVRGGLNRLRRALIAVEGDQRR